MKGKIIFFFFFFKKLISSVVTDADELSIQEGVISHSPLDHEKAASVGLGMHLKITY